MLRKKHKIGNVKRCFRIKSHIVKSNIDSSVTDLSIKLSLIGMCNRFGIVTSEDLLYRSPCTRFPVPFYAPTFDVIGGCVWLYEYDSLNNFIVECMWLFALFFVEFMWLSGLFCRMFLTLWTIYTFMYITLWSTCFAECLGRILRGRLCCVFLSDRRWTNGLFQRSLCRLQLWSCVSNYYSYFIYNKTQIYLKPKKTRNIKYS